MILIAARRLIYRRGYSSRSLMRSLRPASKPRPRRLALAIVFALCLAGAAGVAYASELPGQISSNWAGYAAITGPSTRAFAVRFKSVSGTWTQPAATCVAGQPTFSAFWVGLGGYKQRSKALEQIGSEADCSASGLVSYYAWFEYVPAGPNNIQTVPVSPGDQITASDSVTGRRATVSLTDTTTGATFTHTKLMRSPKPDVSAAEWIAEAPSNCNQNGCSPLTLTNFGSVDFTNATATSVGIDGYHTGFIDDPDWIYGAINLQSSPHNFRFGFGHQQQSLASPGALGASGNAFTVTFGASGPSGLTGVSGASGGSGATGTTGPT